MPFFLTDKTLERNCIMFLPDLHSVYKMTINKTGHFYIGVTKDLKKRVDNHAYMIADAIMVEGGSYKSVLPFHKKVAEVLKFDHQFNGTEIDRVVRKGITIQVLAIVKGRKYAESLESMLIADNLSDPLCTNVCE